MQAQRGGGGVVTRSARKRALEEEKKEEKEDHDAAYVEMKARFETNVCFVYSWEGKHWVFVEREVDAFGKTTGFVRNYRSHYYHWLILMKDGVPESEDFFTVKWLRDPTKKSYAYADYFPDPAKCPANVMNRFVFPRFHDDAIPPDHADFDAEFVDFVLEYIRRMAGGGGGPSESADAVLDFMALNVQRYGDKARMLWLHGPDGCGHSAIANLLKGVLGPHLCCSSGGTDICSVLDDECNHDLKGKLLIDFGKVQSPLKVPYATRLGEMVFAKKLSLKTRWRKTYYRRNFPVFAKMVATCTDLAVIPPCVPAVVVTCRDKGENSDAHFTRMDEIEANVDAKTPEWRNKFASLAGFLTAREITTENSELWCSSVDYSDLH